MGWRSIKGGGFLYPDTPVLQYFHNNMTSQQYEDSFPALLDMPSRYTVAGPVVSEPLPEAFQGGAIVPENWEDERHLIAGQVRKNASPISATEIIRKMSGYRTKLKPNHEHYRRAVEWMNMYPVPKNIGEFFKQYHPCDWEIFGELLLLLIRARKLPAPTEFQLFVVSIRAHEYGVDVCPDCGLTEGPWCRKSLCITVANWLLISPIGDDNDDEVFWYPVPQEDGTWSYPTPESEGLEAEDTRTESWDDLAVRKQRRGLMSESFLISSLVLY